LTVLLYEVEFHFCVCFFCGPTFGHPQKTRLLRGLKHPTPPFFWFRVKKATKPSPSGARIFDFFLLEERFLWWGLTPHLWFDGLFFPVFNGSFFLMTRILSFFPFSPVGPQQTRVNIPRTLMSPPVSFPPFGISFRIGFHSLQPFPSPEKPLAIFFFFPPPARFPSFAFLSSLAGYVGPVVASSPF